MNTRSDWELIVQILYMAHEARIQKSFSVKVFFIFVLLLHWLIDITVFLKLNIWRHSLLIFQFNFTTSINNNK